MIIRPMESGDVPACVEIIRESLGDSDAKSCAECLREEFSGVNVDNAWVRRIVANAAGRVVGLAGAYHEQQHPKWYCGIGWFAVAKAQRGLGLGCLLLKASEFLVRWDDGTHMFVWADPAAVSFYKHHGYAEAEALPKIEPRECNGILLVKPLKATVTTRVNNSIHSADAPSHSSRPPARPWHFSDPSFGGPGRDAI